MHKSIIILFLFAISIHNIEEAIWLSRRSLKTNKIRIHKSIQHDDFLFGLFVVTSLAYLVTILYIFYPSNFIFKYTYFGFLSSMIINIIFPHLISTIVERCYSPGLLTGISVIIPTNILIIGNGFTSNTITLINFIIGTLVVNVILFLLIPLSFKLGKKIITF
ncbi:HXXEE domain-containing protein [Bacillus pseudomycoides]|uniref:HXXEE domain-containing protein n=1 Tax=Bacillus pseudomycoides TaxID=64104 RepID=UPI000BF54786|nr:HXXEE domain-containing protein [Bacillus pseudomycoides]PGC21178.1 HXXEE domain-containing protein [Bacillus pseudomycoides]